MLTKIVNKIVKLFKLYILQDKFLGAHRQWIKDNGDSTLRLNYDLNENSIVFDLGGFHGDFANDIYNKYSCTIYVFEPVKAYYESIKSRFESNKKIKVFHFGLSNIDSSVQISVLGSASSIYRQEATTETIELKSITNFIQKEAVKKIDLFKINIEGGEFDILPELIKTDYINNIIDLQIQFHNFVENSKEKRSNIRDDLGKTHKLTYNYYFIWENWRKNDTE